MLPRELYFARAFSAVLKRQTFANLEEAKPALMTAGNGLQPE